MGLTILHKVAFLGMKEVCETLLMSEETSLVAVDEVNYWATIFEICTPAEKVFPLPREEYD